MFHVSMSKGWASGRDGLDRVYGLIVSSGSSRSVSSLDKQSLPPVESDESGSESVDRRSPSTVVELLAREGVGLPGAMWFPQPSFVIITAPASVSGHACIIVPVLSCSCSWGSLGCTRLTPAYLCCCMSQMQGLCGKVEIRLCCSKIFP